MVREWVNNAKLLTCFTCPLCNNIFRNATSISECLDISSKQIKKYVRKGKKIQEKPKQLQEELPITLQDVKKEVKQQGGIEILDEVSTILSARRAKIAARKKFIRTELTPTAQPDKVAVDHQKKDDNCPRLETVTDTPKIRFKNSSKPESSSQKIVFKNVSRDNAESWKEKAACEPLNWLVETTNKNKSLNNSTMQENGVIPMLVDSSDNDSHHVTKFEVMKHCNNHQTEAEGDQNDPKLSSLKFKLKRVEEKRVKFFEDLNLPALPENESNEDFGSFWFSLVASKEQELGALPQISFPYLRVKDGSLPVSHIKKYIVKKLNLASEDEVEILLGDKPVLCSMQLQNLMELWLETMSKNERVETSVGSSAKDFVMVLSYRRKA
ncbi:hypothetical protein TSUD_31020 [Trifolium subterraneum]|uniref:Uncharacterized protein n=1 Tax=Trifolium subterraneum TaxID=3900 RepID=A0A2Z6M3Y9_TRISU|nr:hypothetical protein TSUD_31020 [Trifolium subterraneum]